MIINLLLLTILIVSLPGVYIAIFDLSEQGPIARLIMFIIALIIFVITNIFLYKRYFKGILGDSEENDSPKTWKYRMKYRFMPILLVGAIFSILLLVGSILGSYINNKYNIDIQEMASTLITYLPIFSCLVIVVLCSVAMFKAASRRY